MDAKELKPCPFCGSSAEYDSSRWNGIDVHDKANNGHAVYCSKCPLPSVGGCLQFDTKEEAFEQWNRRAPSDAAQAPLTDEHRDAIEYAQQVLRQVEAGDGTFVGQCAAAISGLDALLTAAPVAPAAASPSEHEKMMLDAVIHGQGFMKDGQHVPLDQVRAQPDPFARMASGPELQERLARATCTCKGVLGHSLQCAMFDESMMRATAPQAKWECAASKQGSAGGNDPAECDWPLCGCDPKATEVIAALQECDLLKDRPGTRAPIYQIGANAGGGIAWWDVDKDRYEREKKAGFMKTGIVYREPSCS